MRTTYQDFLRFVVSQLELLYPRSPASRDDKDRYEALIRLYYRDLGVFAAEQLIDALERIRRSHRSTTWPTIAEIIGAVHQALDEAAAKAARERALTQPARYQPYTDADRASKHPVPYERQCIDQWCALVRRGVSGKEAWRQVYGNEFPVGNQWCRNSHGVMVLRRECTAAEQRAYDAHMAQPVSNSIVGDAA